MSESEFINEVKQIRDDTLSQLRNTEDAFYTEMELLWQKMFGQKKEVVSQRYETVQKHITELYKEMLEEERENLQELQEALAGLIEESDALQRELFVTIKLPFEIDVNGFALKKQKEELEKFLTSYKEIKQERIMTLEEYKEEERALCTKLGIKVQYQSFHEVPSEAKLKEIQTYLRNLKLEKESRLNVFLTTISEIKEFMNDLEIFPSCPFEITALEKQEDFHLSEKNMNSLQDWKVRLVNQLEEESKTIAELKDKISLLWDRLDIDSCIRETFLVRSAKQCGRSVIELLKKELYRCEELKKANIETVILRLRNDILDFWEKCHIDQKERNLFIDYYSQEFNEELLEIHEQKIEHLQQYYNETSTLFGAAEKWFELWNKMLCLENQSNNAQRLNNRGGQLLKEERERKKIQKELPKVEAKLEKLIKSFEEKHSKPFLYNGQPLMEVIATFWDNRRAEKENEKEVRKIQNATRMTPLKSVSRGVATSTASCNRKRVRPTTPVEMPARRELQMSAKRRSKSQETLGRYGSNMNLRSASANSSVVSYVGFQNYIESKSRSKTPGMSLRSSLSPNQPESTTKANIFKTPSKTVTPLVKRSRLQTTYSASKIRPMIN